jgi:polyisoprenoid-binding protein YceI
VAGTLDSVSQVSLLAGSRLRTRNGQEKRLDGPRQVATGSVAGFRVRESFLGVGNDVTGRTGDVTGTAVVSNGRVASATFRVSLYAITVNGKARQPQLVQSLQVAAHPVATVTLAGPVMLPATFSSGATITLMAAGTLTLNGITRPVTVTLSARRDGTAIEAAGSLPVTFAELRHQGTQWVRCPRVAGRQRDG